MENFDETNLRKVTNGLLKGYPVNHLRFINNCADHTLDISTLLNECFGSAQILEIKSNGPVTANANVSVVVFNFI